jgi:hypothetical protein
MNNELRIFRQGAINLELWKIWYLSNF